MVATVSPDVILLRIFSSFINSLQEERSISARIGDYLELRHPVFVIRC